MAVKFRFEKDHDHHERDDKGNLLWTKAYKKGHEVMVPESHADKIEAAGVAVKLKEKNVDKPAGRPASK